MNNPALFINRRLVGWLLTWLALCVIGLAVWPGVHAEDTPPEIPDHFVFLPLIQTEALPPSPPKLTPRQWDPRLDARGAVLNAVEPAPGQGYWRLVSARWFNEEEAGGRHHILVDLLDAEGERLVDVPVRIYWGGGETILYTQAKSNEPYAADFGMFDVAPSYGAAPITGDAADDVWGMGLGSIEQPKHTIHSSYGLVWQWTLHTDAATITPSPTATPTPTETSIPSEETPTLTPTPTSTPTPPSADTEPTREWDPRLDARGVTLTPAQVAPGQGYWRLVRARWFDEQESNGRHHIFMDLLDAGGARLVAVPVRVPWNGGEAILYSEAKPGEPYAASFGMNSAGPSYGAQPADGHPADSLWGMGLGSIEQPYHAIQTSYGLVWQWTIKPAIAESSDPKRPPTLTAAP